VDINQADAAAVQAVALDEEKDLIVVRLVSGRKCMKKSEDLFPVLQIPAGNFTNDEWMHTDLLRIQQGRKARASVVEVIHPDRGIDKDHLVGLRRGTRFAWRSVPPSAARRCAL